MKTSPFPPRLVELDPWLEPYSQVISDRRQRALEAIQQWSALGGNLASACNTHEEQGIHFDPTQKCWVYREWAPEAQSLSLVGDFNAWDGADCPMQRRQDGLWEVKLAASQLGHGDRIKIRVTGANGETLDRIPACIRRTQQDPENYDFAGQVWQAEPGYVFRHEFKVPTDHAPLIYEAHVGMAGEEARIHTYREFTRDLLPRIAAEGYNTIQLMAVQEHPYYGSFGYHVSSFFAPSSRFGTPEDLKELIDKAHGLNIAVLLDVVHSHAVKNIAEGLADFDGSHGLYFHPGERGEHPQWDSKLFDYGRPEVCRFLLSNLRYWLEEFRFDGFRFDGITSMLYHHHGLESFDHYDKYFGAGVDADALLYLQLATHLCKEIRPDCLLIAEDMSGMPGLCRPIDEGGIGFDYRLAMGIPDFWIRLLKHQRDEEWQVGEIWDTLSNRRSGEKSIAYAESHDQALVGDKTLAFWLMDQEMYWHMDRNSENPLIDRGIALHKMLRLITLSLGGEGYLNFIGNEFGHPEWVDFPREGNDWSYQYCRRQWSLADNEDLRYRDLLAFDQAMLQMSRERGLLESDPARPLHFDPDNQVLIAERAGLIFAFNFSPEHSIPNYRFSIPDAGTFEVILDSDSVEFGGHKRLEKDIQHHSLKTESGHELSIYLPNRTALVMAPVR